MGWMGYETDRIQTRAGACRCCFFAESGITTARHTAIASLLGCWFLFIPFIYVLNIYKGHLYCILLSGFWRINLHIHLELGDFFRVQFRIAAWDCHRRDWIA